MDYKTGKNDLDEDLIRRGLQLQLIIYMEALLNAGSDSLDVLAEKAYGSRPAGPDAGRADSPADAQQEIVPSAMLYYRMSDPVIRRTAADIDLTRQEEKGSGSNEEGLFRRQETEEIHGQLRPTGLVYEDEESIDHLDRSFSGRSDVIPVTRKKAGGYTAASRLIDRVKYAELAGKAREAVCSLAEQILDGDISAAFHQGNFKFLDKNALASKTGKGLIQTTVALGSHGDQFVIQILAQGLSAGDHTIRHQAGLGHGKFTLAGGYAEYSTFHSIIITARFRVKRGMTFNGQCFQCIQTP